MNDREFLELLNLYVDHEISPADALRLENEVVTNPARRETYDEYCRMQKACSMLSEEVVGAVPELDADVVAFPQPGRWRYGPMAAGLAAAAACLFVVLDVRHRAQVGTSDVAAVTLQPSPRPNDVAGLPNSQDAMKAVFVVRPSDSSLRAQRVRFDEVDTGSQMAQFNWIGDIHMEPVFTTPSPDSLLNTKTDLKASALTDSQARELQEPAEMAAFRFQR